MAGAIRTSVSDDVGTITIDNPEKRNALSPCLLTQLTDAFERCDSDTDVCAIVLESASGRAAGTFSAGYDTTKLSNQVDREEGEQQFGELVTTVRDCEQPTIAALSGDVFGAAVELVCTCDVRFAVEDARFCVPVAKFGLVYPIRGIQTLLGLAGPADTKELLFSGDPVSARRAREMGFVNRVVGPDELASAVDAFASTLATNAPLSMAGTKTIIHRLLETDSLSESDRVELEEVLQAAFESEDFQEGVEAFAEGRDPVFRGE